MTARDVKAEKKCITCKETKPLTPTYWRRLRHSPDGFATQCKVCASESIKKHYRGWKMRDVLERGEFGVRCVLWAPFCGVCPVESEDDMSLCWRLADIAKDDEGYPIPIE